MLGLLVGFALGAMALTETGREVGNKMWDYGARAAKKAMDSVSKSKPTEQSTGTAGDDSYTG